MAAAGDPKIVDELKAGKQLGGRTYKVHLDGYDQTNLITGKGPSSRNEIFYFAEGTLGAVRIGDFKYRFIDQPGGWLGGTVKPDVPILVNLRLARSKDRLPGSFEYFEWFKFEFWRFVFSRKWPAAQTFIEFPPMQKAQFQPGRLKEELAKKMEMMKSRVGMAGPSSPGTGCSIMSIPTFEERAVEEKSP